MPPFDDSGQDELPVVNVFDFCLAQGLSRVAAVSIVMQIILDQSYAYEEDIRRTARTLGYNLPYCAPDTGQVH